MTPRQYFEQHKEYPEPAGLRGDPYLHMAAFLNYCEEQAEHHQHLKDEVVALLDHIIIHEWNVSGGGMTRMKNFVEKLKSDT